VNAAQPIKTRAGFFARFRMMTRVGLSMMFHDKAKLVGTLLGVVFAVVLINQQGGIFLGLLNRNVMFVENTDADVWIAPPGTESLAPGRTVSTSAMFAARTAKGVAWAEPLIFAGGSVKTPSGGTEQVTLIGAKYPRYAGGPWNIVAGDAASIGRPDTMTFEDSERDTLGALNLGSVREVNGRRMTVGAFTWGLEPFGPSYAFTDFETARELAHVASDQASYVLVKAEPGVDANALASKLQESLPGTKVMTRAEFRGSIANFIVFKQSLGTSFGVSLLIGLVVGFVIVALSMFSSVVDNIREFGTLKAVGSTNVDLSMLLFVQAITYAIIGSIIGLAAVTRIAAAMSSAKLTVILPAWLLGGTLALMIVVCITASVLALLRIRKVEPAMVFR
jgi:putative ABC transport system permease protein